MSQGQGSASSAEESLVDSQSGQDKSVLNNSVTEQPADVNASSTNLSHNSISSDDDDLKRDSSSRVSVERKPVKNSSNEPSTRPVRTTSLSLKGKESKISSLNLDLGRKINSHIRYFNQIQLDMAEGITLDDLTTLSDEMNAEALVVSNMYNDLCRLCDNKPSAQIEKMFQFHDAAVSNFNELVEKQVQDLELQELEEVENSIQQANEEMEEETRLFEEYMNKMKQKPLQISLTAKEKVKAGQVISTRGSTEAKARSSREATASAPTQRSTNMLQTSGSTSYNEPFKDGSHPLPLKRSEQVSEVSSPLPTVHSERQELDAVKHLAESLAAAINCSKKSVEPSIFEGDVLQFSDWEVDLDTYLRTERIKGHERLRHLKKFINGEARKCIEGYFTTNTDDAYLAARAALKDCYGNEQTIARTFRRKLDAWPKVPPRDWKALTEFSDFLCHLNSAMVTIKPLKVLNDCVENEKILEKVSDWLRIKWAHIVAKAVRCEQRGDDRYPNFQEFSDFIKDEAYVMSLPISQAATPRIKDNKLKATRTYFSATTEREDACLFCNLKNHKTTDCRRLQDKSKEDKNKFVREKGLCFRCFSSGHRSKGCKATLTCNICHKHHASANHDLNWNEHREKKLDRAGEKPESKPTSKKEPPTKVKETKPLQHEKAVTDISVKATSTLNELSVRGIRTRQGLTSMAIPVYVSAGTGAEMLVYALLDNQSDACFISRDVISTLKPKVTEVEPVKICTLNGEKETDLNRYDSIRLRGYSTDYHTVISVFEQPKIALDREQLPTPEKAEKVNHLRSIANQMPPLLDIPIGLLLGMNYPELIQPLEIKPAPDNAPGKPFGVRTTFGWTMCGGSSSSRAARNKTVFKINLKSDTEILRVLERDFQDIEQDKSMSQEDIKFLQTLESGTIQSQQGNYILPLPFKRNPDLPNNRSQAEKRLTLLMKKLQADKGYSQEYVKFMNDFILAGHPEQVPQDELAKHVGVWYLPHFGVRHPQKKKLRVVFDASARFKGAALNDFLHTGPDHMNSLLGILLRFRREPIAFTCDIQQMFHNFLVTPQHRDYLRFLWTNDDPKIIQEFRMKVHLFGATSSPGVATFGLRKVAEDYRNISTEATRFLKDDFYVDDGVTSVSTPQEAKELIKAATTICTKANIRLHKFTCNNEEVLSTVPISERKEVSKSIDIFKDSLYCERTLGMEWNICSDTFHYTTPTSAKPATRRGILSTIARIYDPIGFVSPIVLKGKQILQQITMANQSWDQLLNPSVKLEWDKWYAGLSNLPLLKIKRCFKPSEEVKVTELHHYSDASLQGYGACSYLRQITKDGKVSCSLLLAKARVTPLKTQTIPRLELQGAVIATRLATTLRKELKIKIDSEFFWTDSKITLGYIANDAKRFHMFVANRVQEIKQTTTPQQWHHVLSNDNPADLVSRGATVLELSQKSIWFDGPTYLQQTDITDYIVKTSTERKG